MTELTFQNVHIDDCETWIAREYYYWGKVQSELEWEAASFKGKQTAISRGFNMYDGCDILRDNVIKPSDAGLTVTIFSRITADDVKHFLVAQPQLTAMLAEIPSDRELIHASDLELKIVGNTIDEFCQRSEGIERSKATKVLHKKRPAFLPVIDGNVGRALWLNFPHLLKEGSGTTAYLQVCREILRRFEEAFSTIQDKLRSEWDIRLTRARIVSFLLYQWFKKTGRTTQKLAMFWETPQFRTASQEMWNET